MSAAKIKPEALEEKIVQILLQRYAQRKEHLEKAVNPAEIVMLSSRLCEIAEILDACKFPNHPDVSQMRWRNDAEVKIQEVGQRFFGGIRK